MYHDLAEKIFTKVDLENDDKPCYFKNFISNPEQLVTWNDVEDCMNNTNFYEFELIDEHCNKIVIPEHQKAWNYYKPVQDKQFIFDKVNNGAGLVITNYGFHNDYTNELLSRFEEMFDVHAAIHVYAGLKSHSSFSVHDDYPSNFIIQVEGTTHWKVFENRISSLFSTGRMNGRVNNNALRAAIDVTLEPGDALYIPSRAYHIAEPTNTRLSISIPCWQRLKTDAPTNAVDRNKYRINKNGN